VAIAMAGSSKPVGVTPRILKSSVLCVRVSIPFTCATSVAGSMKLRTTFSVRRGFHTPTSSGTRGAKLNQGHMLIVCMFDCLYGGLHEGALEMTKAPSLDQAG